MTRIEALAKVKDNRDKDSIIKNSKGLGTSLRKLGLTLEDIDKPKYMFDVECERFAKGDDIISLYRYTAWHTSGYGKGGTGPNTRSFCKDLVRKNNKALYSYQDILKIRPMKGMGKGGSNIYSVFKFRGGVRCKHVWVKYYYSKKAKKLMEAKATEQPTQIGKGNLPNA
jgi:hypothetical protein